MADCRHCDGTGVCQDDYHGDITETVSGIFVSSSCPSGCGGGSMGPGADCPHCDGTGEE